eukprot:52139_1
MSKLNSVMENPDGISPSKMVFNMLNQIIGIGIICYHWSFVQIGIIPCVIASILYGYLTSFSAHLLIKSSLRCNKKAWGDIVMDLFGVPQFLIFNVAIVFACVVFGSSYLSAAAQWITSSISTELKPTAFKVSIVMVASSTLSLCAALVKNLDRFAKVSMLSNAIAIITLIMIIGCAVFEPEFAEGRRNYKWVEDVSMIPLTIGILATTYVYTQITLQLFYSLKRPSLSVWHKSEFCGMTVVILLNIVVGILGYFAFKHKKHLKGPDKLDDNILQNFAPGNHMITACKIGYAVSILLTFPMQMLSGRKSAAFLYNFCLDRKLDQELSATEFRCITVVVWLISVAVGIYANYYSLTSVLSIGGCFVGTYMGFVLPAACYIWSNKNATSRTLAPLEKVIAASNKGTVNNGEIQTEAHMNSTGPEDDSFFDTVGAWCTLVVGFILMFGATGVSIYNEYNKKPSISP